MEIEKLRVCTLYQERPDRWLLEVPNSFNNNLRKCVDQGIEAAMKGQEPNISTYSPGDHWDAYMDGYNTVIRSYESGLLDVGLTVATKYE